MNYFFLATAFFSFHLLLAYLADLISIVAFTISSFVSFFLVVSYLRLVTGLRFAAVESRPDAIDLPRIVFLRLLLQRDHRTGDHNRRDSDAVRRHAAHRTNPLVRNALPFLLSEKSGRKIPSGRQWLDQSFGSGAFLGAGIGSVNKI